MISSNRSYSSKAYRSVGFSLVLFSSILLSSCFYSDHPLYEANKSDCGFLSGKTYDVFKDQNSTSSFSYDSTWSFSGAKNSCELKIEKSTESGELASNIDNAKNYVFSPLTDDIVIIQFEDSNKESTGYWYSLAYRIKADNADIVTILRPNCKNPNYDSRQEVKQAEALNYRDCTPDSKEVLEEELRRTIAKYKTAKFQYTTAAILAEKRVHLGTGN